MKDFDRMSTHKLIDESVSPDPVRDRLRCRSVYADGFQEITTRLLRVEAELEYIKQHGKPMLVLMYPQPEQVGNSLLIWGGIGSSRKTLAARCPHREDGFDARVVCHGRKWYWKLIKCRTPPAASNHSPHR